MFIFPIVNLAFPALAERGFMDCPTCNKRTPAKLKKKRRWYLVCRIPILPDLYASPTAYQCLECLEHFTYVDPSPYDFGPHQKSRLWPCPRCSHQNLAWTYDCLKCDYSMTRSLG